MRPILSRIPRKTKVTAVVLGAALLQVGVLAALGLDSSRSRLQTRRQDLATRSEDVVKTRVIAVAQDRLADLERQATRELQRTAGPAEERVGAALGAMRDLADAPIFVHGFVVDETGAIWHWRRPPIEVPPSIRDDSLRRRLGSLLELERRDPRKAMLAAGALADEVEARPAGERDCVAAARALRIAWRAALRSKNASQARGFAARVVDRYAALQDDRPPPKGDSEPFGVGAGEVLCSLLREAVSRSSELRDAFVQAVVERQLRAQRLGSALGPAGQALERRACRDLLAASALDLRPEDKLFIEFELGYCDAIDSVQKSLLRVPKTVWQHMLQTDDYARTRIPDPTGERLALVVPIRPHGDGDQTPRRAAIFPSEALALQAYALDAVRARQHELPDGVRLIVEDRGGQRLVGKEGRISSVFDPLPFQDAAPGLTASAYLLDPGALDRAIHRERNFWLWTLAAAGLAVIAASLLAIRAVLRELQLARMKSDFVSNLSHELRTPLTSLRMFVETLLEGRVRDEAERQECLGIIAQETDRLSRLVDRILQFAAYAKGRAPIDLQPSDSGEVVTRAVDLFRSRALKLGAKLELVVQPDLPPAVIDRDAIVQVVLNLLDNAVKYAGHDGARIRVSVRAAGARVRIEVEDDGPGVPERERETVFEEFYRGDDRLSGPVQGTGIGLALCRRIALAHGGRIEALRSKELGGALFRLTLPDAETARKRALKGSGGN